MDLRTGAMIGNQLYHTPGSKGGYCSTSSSSSFLGCGIARFLSLRPASRSVRVASRSHVRVASRSQGTNFETKIFNFRCFLALSTETSFTTTHYYPKYDFWALQFFCGRIPLNWYNLGARKCSFVVRPHSHGLALLNY